MNLSSLLGGLVFGILLGFLGGLLVYRRHRERLVALEAEARKKAEAIKETLSTK